MGSKAELCRTGQSTEPCPAIIQIHEKKISPGGAAAVGFCDGKAGRADEVRNIGKNAGGRSDEGDFSPAGEGVQTVSFAYVPAGVSVYAFLLRLLPRGGAAARCSARNGADRLANPALQPLLQGRIRPRTGKKGEAARREGQRRSLRRTSGKGRKVSVTSRFFVGVMGSQTVWERKRARKASPFFIIFKILYEARRRQYKKFFRRNA